RELEEHFGIDKEPTRVRRRESLLLIKVDVKTHHGLSFGHKKDDNGRRDDTARSNGGENKHR
ncbi:unnamed protein product, partial [Sphenostylis stenocarpa]